MKWWYILFLFFSSTLLVHAQSLVQTFVDRCTGEVKTIVIPFEGSTVVVFYNRSRSFTINDVRSGVLQVWLEETYLWWQNISPCSTNQATTTATQTTTSNATQNATASATSSTSSATQATSPTTGSTNQTSSQSSQGSSTDSQSSSGETNTNSTDQQSEQTGGSDSGSSESNQEGDNSSGDESSSEQEQSSESEESSEGESEDDGEDSDDGEESEEKDNKQSVKKSNPIIVAANVATMSSLDGSINFVTNIGLSQASLLGNTSYSLNTMVWDNLKQFNVNVGKTYIQKKPTNTFYSLSGNVKTTGGEIEVIQTSSINFMYMFGAINLSYGKSFVWPLENSVVAGTAVTMMVMKYEDTYTVLPTAIGFATKPYSFYRYTVSPMFAVAFNPIMYSNIVNNLTYNSNAMFVIGSSGTFNLTKNFFLNLGFNIVESTANLPMTWAATIGSRFQF